MAISTLNDIKKGVNVLHEGEPYLVVEANFVRMQQRKPVMQTKMRNLLNGKVAQVNFHPGDKVDEADLMRKKVDYLYNDGENWFFMSNDDFEQFTLPKESLGDKIGLMKEGDKVDALYFNGNAVSVSLQPKVELKVVSAPEGDKGNSAQGRVTKTAELETGMNIQVPLFVKEGDIIRINTETVEYVERVSQ
ncbi:MAG: Elongation factor P [Parcubacteria group bacterium ADurb.Bin326]|nr:MAG: Elongation factor P [Parcubacteria group bacterium ADurb.Bin326]